MVKDQINNHYIVSLLVASKPTCPDLSVSEDFQEEGGEEVSIPSVVRASSWPHPDGSPVGDRLRVKREEKPVRLSKITIMMLKF